MTHIQTAEGNMLLEMLQFQMVIREWRLVQAVWSVTPDLTDCPLRRATDVQISPFWTHFHGKFMEAAEDAILTTEFLKMFLKCSLEKLGFYEEAATYTYCQE